MPPGFRHYQLVTQAKHEANSSDEPVFTAEEIGVAKKFHPSTIRKLFAEEPGVIRLGCPGSNTRRPYYTLRIPASVVDRVFRRMAVNADADSATEPEDREGNK